MSPNPQLSANLPATGSATPDPADYPPDDQTPPWSLFGRLQKMVWGIAALLVLFVWMIFHAQRETAENQARAEVSLLARIVAEDATQRLHEGRIVLGMLATQFNEQEINAGRCGKPGALPTLLAMLPGYGNLVLADQHGNVVCSAQPGPGNKKQNVADFEWFRTVMSTNDLGMGRLRKGPISGLWSTGMALPLRDAANNPKAALLLTLNMSTLESVNLGNSMPVDSVLQILDDSGMIVASSASPETWIGRRVDEHPLARAALRARRDGVTVAAGFDGVERYYSYSSIPEHQWVALVGIPVAAVLQPAQQTLLRNTGLAVLAGMLALAGMALVLRSIRRPLRRMRDALLAIENDHTLRLPEIGPAEMRSVAHAINQTLNRLEDQDRKLQEHESRLKMAAEAANIGYWDRDLTSNTLHVSAEWMRLLGYGPEDPPFTHTQWRACVHPDDYAHLAAKVQRAQTGTASGFSCEIRALHRDGKYRHMISRGVILRNADGVALRMYGYLADIDERARRENTLRLQAMAGIAIARSGSFESALFEVLRLICEFSGWKIGEVWLPNADRSRMAWSGIMYSQLPNIGQFMALSRGLSYAEGELFVGTVWQTRRARWHLNQGGARRALLPPGISARCGIPMAVDERVLGVLSFYAEENRQVEDAMLDTISGIASHLGALLQRRQIEEKLQQREAALRELAHRLVTVEETDRKNFSRELHDRIGQELAAMNLNFDMLRLQLPQDAAVHRRIDDAQQLLCSVIADTRDIMAGLRPPGLDTYGLGPALTPYAERCSRRFGIPIHVADHAAGCRLEETVEIALFRITQEAVINAVKHAQASRIDIRIDRAGDQLLLTIMDNGKGMDPAPAATGSRDPDNTRRDGGNFDSVITSTGYGMATMRERAEAAGIHLRLITAPGAGVKVCASARLPAPAAEQAPVQSQQVA